MKRLIVGSCAVENIFDQSDPDTPSEAEFEAAVVQALTCLYPDYICFRFAGGFEYDNAFRPDLALVARNLSHWFVIEVELTSHSLDYHVLPQVRAFQFGEPLADCSKILARELGLDLGTAESLVEYLPRSVAVVANRYHEHWESKLQALAVQLLTVSVFRTASGLEAVELSGQLDVRKENLGFGRYSSIDRSILFTAEVRLPEGPVQIVDPGGSCGIWNVIRQQGVTWVTKELGTPVIADDCFLQLTRTFDGRLVLRSPAATGRRVTK